MPETGKFAEIKHMLAQPRIQGIYQYSRENEENREKKSFKLFFVNGNKCINNFALANHNLNKVFAITFCEIKWDSPPSSSIACEQKHTRYSCIIHRDWKISLWVVL